MDAVSLPDFTRYHEQEILHTVPPFPASPKHKINACAIEKNSNTVLTGIMWLCEDLNESWFFMNGSTDLKEINEWLHLAIVRDPFERFISGFVDKCIIERTFTRANRKTACNGCGSSIVCFIHREYDRMMRFARGEPDEFVRRSPLLSAELFFDVLEQRNVSATDIAFLKGQVFGTRTVHATSASGYRQKYELRVRRDPLLMRMLVRMYYFDYIIFNYPLAGVLIIHMLPISCC
ncbi:hypothetical protein M3Y99_01888200 [Aphelenchoides fujianensis]|nr:hypothetical protein M3Y99_01888200 [Aphelenchoides fujianensis]